MFDKTDILKRLQNGDTVDAIAQEMADALNAAASEKRDLDAKREAEEKALEAKRAEEDRIYAAKREAVCGIVDSLCDFAVAAGADDMLEELHKVDLDKMVRALDEMLEFASGLERLVQLQFPRAEKKVTVRSDDEVLQQFLKDMFD